jgi:signal transduction protein with GAF and PtsI domain
MKDSSIHATGDRRIAEGLFQWRDDYQTQFEHFTESLKAAQKDYNTLSHKFQIAKTPIDVLEAWTAFVQQRMSHLEQAIHRAVESGVNWKSLARRATNTQD